MSLFGLNKKWVYIWLETDFTSWRRRMLTPIVSDRMQLLRDRLIADQHPETQEIFGPLSRMSASGLMQLLTDKRWTEIKRFTVTLPSIDGRLIGDHFKIITEDCIWILAIMRHDLGGCTVDMVRSSKWPGKWKRLKNILVFHYYEANHTCKLDYRVGQQVSFGNQPASRIKHIFWLRNMA
jgi:hypothetical protein